MKTRVVFFGTPELSVPFLQSLIDSETIDVVGVVTQPPKPVGRKKILTKSPVHIRAEQYNIPVFPLAKLKTEEATKHLRACNADIFAVVVYGKIIPKAILDLPKNGCINVHPSLLPAYRGPTPYQQAILDGLTETGISIMLLDEGMDTGPVLTTTTFALDRKETSETVQSKIIAKGVPLFTQTLLEWVQGTRTATPQQDDQATYCPMHKKEDGIIDWDKPAVTIERMIRAYAPWPGTYTYWTRNGNNVRINILDADVIESTKSNQPGTIDIKNDQLQIQCGDNTTLRINKLQLEGKQPTDATSIIRGYPELDGSVWYAQAPKHDQTHEL